MKRLLLFAHLECPATERFLSDESMSCFWDTHDWVSLFDKAIWHYVTASSKKFLDIQATIEPLSLKRVCDMIITYSQLSDINWLYVILEIVKSTLNKEIIIITKIIIMIIITKIIDVILLKHYVDWGLDNLKNFQLSRHSISDSLLQGNNLLQHGISDAIKQFLSRDHVSSVY